ncbi:MAG TPA: signal peptidase I [Ktedonobacteraceae bacterium]|nr:signal peptidase I [Ktedonobacteraceae bacterium]
MQPPKAPARRFMLRQIIETITLTLLMILVVRIAVQNFHIQGPSMEPTLHDQEFIIVDKASYLLSAPTRGDIIVFEYPLDTRQNYVKRIVAVPGDIISVVNQKVTVNGVTLHENYVNKNDPYNPFPSFTNRIVGPDDYFVMGDNRGDSSDSRQWGFVPRQDIIGRVAFVYWPVGVDNFGVLPNVSSVFAKLHQ